MGGRGIVATGHPAVSAAGARVLAEGGNAFDAAVACGFASAMAEPALTSLGGGGFLLARSPGRAAIVFDFFVDGPGRGRNTASLDPHFLPVTVRFPGSDQVFNVGLGAVAVPGTLKGLLHVHGRLGSLPLADVVAPAEGLAREGVRMTAKQAYFLRLLRPIFGLTERSRQTFPWATDSPREGVVARNPPLAAFLRSLPNGAEQLYGGSLAETVDREMREGEGILSVEDLASYRVVEREPLVHPYRNLTLLTNPPPSFGGSLLGVSLDLLASLPVRDAAYASPDHATLLAATLVEVEGLRDAGVTGPGTLEAAVRDAALRRLRASRGTTHIAVADRDGNVASMTNSNGEGSGYVVPESGIMLNNMLGEDDLHPDGFHASPSGLRVSSMMSPSMFLDGDRVVLALGSGGSKRIRSAILQVASHVLDCGRDLQSAVDDPRMHWDGERLHLEPGLPRETVSALAARWPVHEWTERDVYFGGVQAVVPGVGGAADPRRGGAVEVVR